jgi:hypothetical protein
VNNICCMYYISTVKSLSVKILSWLSHLQIQCVSKVTVHLDLWGAAKSTVYHDRPRTLNELKTAMTAFIRNISQADLQKVFANKIKCIHACSWTSLPTHFISAQRPSKCTPFQCYFQPVNIRSVSSGYFILQLETVIIKLYDGNNLFFSP